MNIISKKEAIARNLERFYTGKQCINGHYSERSVKNRTCIECKKEWILSHPNKVKESRNKHNIKYASKRRLSRRTYRANNPAIHAACEAKRRARKLNATPPWANIKTIQNIYKECYIITLNAKAAGCSMGFQVDHIIPLQGENVCGLHVENNLQIITEFENASKHNKY